MYLSAYSIWLLEWDKRYFVVALRQKVNWSLLTQTCITGKFALFKSTILWDGRIGSPTTPDLMEMVHEKAKLPQVRKKKAKSSPIGFHRNGQ